MRMSDWSSDVCSSDLLVCGAFSGDAERSRRSAEALGLDTARAYASFDALLAGEAALPEERRLQALAIVTPNHLPEPMSRSAERRAGKECVGTGRSPWLRDP